MPEGVTLAPLVPQFWGEITGDFGFLPPNLGGLGGLMQGIQKESDLCTVNMSISSRLFNSSESDELSNCRDQFADSFDEGGGAGQHRDGAF
jgi:hypothetical protein